MKNLHTHDILQSVRIALQDRNITAVASATGLNPHTIYRLQQGKTRPNNSTLKLLKVYLNSQGVIHG